MLTDGFFVYNLAHQEQCIRGHQGSIRILGCFSTREEAEAFVYEWTLEQPDLETRVSPINHWRILSKSFMNLEDQKDSFAKRWDAYIQERKDEFQDVEQRAANKIAGTVHSQQETEDTHTVQETKSDEVPVALDTALEEAKPLEEAVRVPRVPKKLEVIGQKQAGIALLQDSARGALEDQEPFFQVLSIADNESEMEDFLKKHSKEQVDLLGVYSSVPLATIVMQEFVPLAKLSTIRTRRQSPNEHLEAIRKNFSFENKDGGLDNSGVEGLAQSPAGENST